MFLGSRLVLTNPVHLDVKRPTRGCGASKARVRHTSTRSRLFAQVDFRREMRPIAFVDPGAFVGYRSCISIACDLTLVGLFDREKLGWGAPPEHIFHLTISYNLYKLLLMTTRDLD